jgi:hypothetical protein
VVQFIARARELQAQWSPSGRQTLAAVPSALEAESQYQPTAHGTLAEQSCVQNKPSEPAGFPMAAHTLPTSHWLLLAHGSHESWSLDKEPRVSASTGRGMSRGVEPACNCVQALSKQAAAIADSDRSRQTEPTRHAMGATPPARRGRRFAVVMDDIGKLASAPEAAPVVASIPLTSLHRMTPCAGRQSAVGLV